MTNFSYHSSHKIVVGKTMSKRALSSRSECEFNRRVTTNHEERKGTE